jgi:hypothetical protein
MKTAPCKGCGKPIVFVAAVGVEGKRGLHPLDPRPPVYVITVWDQDGTPTEAIRMNTAYVSHFATCPKAGQFSGAKRARTVTP